MNANMTMCNVIWGMQLLILICVMSPYFLIVVIVAVFLFASITVRGCLGEGALLVSLPACSACRCT